jgi:hypothetical protein
VARAVHAGAFLLFDEANLRRPEIIAWLNNILGGEDKLEIPKVGEKISVHSEFRAISCSNAGYAGTRNLKRLSGTIAPSTNSAAIFSMSPLGSGPIPRSSRMQKRMGAAKRVRRRHRLSGR